MDLIDDIFSLLFDIADFFYEAYREVKDWVWPFNLLQYPLLDISDSFYLLLDPTAALGDWLANIDVAISSFLDENAILDFLEDAIEAALNSWAWITAYVADVTGMISTWWETVSADVLGWIAEANTYAEGLVDAVALSLGNLATEWDTFWEDTWPALICDLGDLSALVAAFFTDTLPTLATMTNVSDLVESAIKTWLPFYDDLVSLWDDIKEFVTTPFDFMVNKLETWFWDDEVV